MIFEMFLIYSCIFEFFHRLGVHDRMLDNASHLACFPWIDQIRLCMSIWERSSTVCILKVKIEFLSSMTPDT